MYNRFPGQEAIIAATAGCLSMRDAGSPQGHLQNPHIGKAVRIRL
jgi:hypothetical protein